MPDPYEPITHLYLIRHALAVGNVEPIVASFKSDRGLTPRGVQQAERLRDRLAAGEIPADVLLASTMPRALQTAQIIAPGLGLTVQPDDDLQELRVGEADGMAVDEARAKFGVNVSTDPFTPIATGGESWSQFAPRAAATLERITREHQGQRIIAVTHGGFIAAAFSFFFALNLLKMPPVGLAPYPGNTAISYWQSGSLNGQPMWQLVVYNDDTHLRGLDTGHTLDWQELPLPPAYEHGATPEVSLPKTNE